METEIFWYDRKEGAFIENSTRAITNLAIADNDKIDINNIEYK